MPAVKMVIASRARASSIADRTLRIVPDDCLVCVSEDERDAYAAVVGKRELLLHPPTVKGLAAAKNWILKTLTDKIVVIIDDDISGLKCLVGWNPRVYRNGEITRRVLENTAECAAGFKATLFGYNQQENPIGFKPFNPVILHRWIGSVVGVIGRDIAWNENLKLCSDIDANLTSLLKHRVVYCEHRFVFMVKRQSNAGGNSLFRTAASEKEERQWLKDKWGDYVHFGMKVTTNETVLNVPRRWPLVL
jgi:hypothetical protein